jgi:hypothetical protein
LLRRHRLRGREREGSEAEEQSTTGRQTGKHGTSARGEGEEKAERYTNEGGKQ